MTRDERIEQGLRELKAALMLFEYRTHKWDCATLVAKWVGFLEGTERILEPYESTLEGLRKWRGKHQGARTVADFVALELGDEWKRLALQDGLQKGDLVEIREGGTVNVWTGEGALGVCKGFAGASLIAKKHVRRVWRWKGGANG